MRSTLGRLAALGLGVLRGPAPSLATDGAPFQIYSGYSQSQDALLRSLVIGPARNESDRIVDGFGQITLKACIPFAKKFDLEKLTVPIPNDGYHAEAPEYVAVADAVARAGSQFAIAEVGAGWGPWLGLGGVLARNKGIREINLIGVEALPARFELLRDHMRVNGLVEGDADQSTPRVTCRLFNGAIAPERGELWFPDVPVADMGPAASDTGGDRDYRGTRVKNLRVRAYALDEVVGDTTLDLLHIDIQGSELALVEGTLDFLADRVRAIMIGTHSRVIEGALISLLYANGWHLDLEKPCRVAWQQRPVSQEAMTQVDGCQYWRR